MMMMNLQARPIVLYCHFVLCIVVELVADGFTVQQAQAFYLECSGWGVMGEQGVIPSLRVSE